MLIHSVLSFMGSWNLAQNKYSEELRSLNTALTRFLSGEVTVADSEERIHPRALWEKALYDEGWAVTEQAFFTNSGRKLPVRFVGPQKNGLAAQIAFSNPDFLTRWLFTYSTLTVRNGVVKVPILVVPMKDALSEKDRNRHISRMGTFEYYQEQLEMLSPISLNHQFLILGYSQQASLFEASVNELEAEEHAEQNDSYVVINRSIEFPPEYHQAGIGILNYFSTYLNKKYPEQNSTVRIEQSGLKVRMIVETGDGNSEIVERALHEYEQIMSGEESPTKFTDNEKLILELRNEVRVARFRVDSQQDIIALQNEKLKTSEERIDNLLNIVGEGLKKELGSINVQVNPCIQTSLSVTINGDISSSIGSLEELSDLLPKDDDTCLPVIDLIYSLQNIESEKDPEVVRKSSAMAKFSRFINKFADTNDTIKKALDTTQQGYEIVSDLVTKYNKVASWCGLPNIPTFK